MMKYPIRTYSSALSPESLTDSGITSTNATASMYPAPSARKYCRNCLGQSFRTTKYPPIKFPAAATSPSPAASAVRNAKSCAIFGVRRFAPTLSGPACRFLRPHTINRSAKRPAILSPLFSAPSALSLFHSFTLSLFHSFTLSLFHSFTLSLFHSFTLSLFHSFTLSLSSTVPKQNHIPLLDYIFLPLQPHLRPLPRCRQTSRRQQIIPPHHFRADETSLNVAVNRPRRLHGHRALANRPSPHFRLPRREKLDQSQQIIRRANQSVQPRLLQSIRRQQFRGFLLIHLGEFRFQPPANRHHRRIRPPLQCPQLVPLHRRIQLVRFVVPQIQYV